MTLSEHSERRHEHEIIAQGKSSFHPLHFFADGQRVSRCVAMVHIHTRTSPTSGTGFLIGGNWLITNQHVIPNEAVARDAIVMFNFELGNDGLYTAVEQFKLNPAAGFYCSPADGGDDWAVIKICGDANLKYSAIELTATTIALGDALHIIQHPAGAHKQIAMFDQSVISISERRICYLTDTLPGSSGSPVFNNQWQVVALHHSSAESWDKERGCYIRCNEGIPITIVLEGLRATDVLKQSEDDARLEINANTGPMAIDDPWYINRKVDREALQFFRNRAITVALKGGTGSGKSSMAMRVQAAMMADGWQSVNIDIRDQFAVEDFTNGYTFLFQLAKKMVAEIHAGERALRIFEFDRTPNAFKAFLFELEVKVLVKPILITLDGLDAIANKPCCTEVLSGLRAAHNAQSQLGAKHRFKILVIHTIRPLHNTAVGSVFDVARVVEVADLSESELGDLAALYRLQPVDISKLHAFLGGHPGLSRIGLNAMVIEGLTLDQLINQALNDNSVFRPHLQRVWRNFVAAANFDKLALAFENLLNGAELPSDACFESLLALGLVRGSSRSEAKPRCSLYGNYLSMRLR